MGSISVQVGSPQLERVHRLRNRAVLAIVALLGVLLPLAHDANAAVAGVPLGTAGAYAVLGASTVTNTGSTILNGDLGVAPGTAITGFPPGLVVPPGTINSGNAVAQQAQADLTTAYNSAAGRPVNATTAANLAGLTLPGGVYSGPDKSPLSLTGSLTLDGEGDSSSVFIFQTNSTLILGSGATVALINGAQECNVFWQVGSSATIGTGASLAGTILALASITVNTGATIRGRALARNGAVTLDSNTVTKPGCAVVQPPATTTTVPTTDPTVPTTVLTEVVSAEVTAGGGSLPTTGLDVRLILLLAFGLVAIGLWAVRLGRPMTSAASKAPGRLRVALAFGSGLLPEVTELRRLRQTRPSGGAHGDDSHPAGGRREHGGHVGHHPTRVHSLAVATERPEAQAFGESSAGSNRHARHDAEGRCRRTKAKSPDREVASGPRYTTRLQSPTPSGDIWARSAQQSSSAVRKAAKWSSVWRSPRLTIPRAAIEMPRSSNPR